MKNNPFKLRRNSIRLKGYDYGQPGSYFITLNCFNGSSLFGEISDGTMHQNDFGNIAYNEWLQTTEIRTNVVLGKFVVMPDHLHGIITITENLSYMNKPVFLSPSQTLGAIIRGFMSAVTSQVNKVRNTPGEKVWQRNYFEHIIRSEKPFHRISQYILNNPANFDQKDLLKLF